MLAGHWVRFSYRGTQHQICSPPPSRTQTSPSLSPQSPPHKSTAPLLPFASARGPGRLCIPDCQCCFWSSCKRSHLVDTGDSVAVLLKDYNATGDTDPTKTKISPGFVALQRSLTVATGAWPPHSAPAIRTTSNESTEEQWSGRRVH